MLRSIHQLYGNQLGATDGEIGHVKDFYFNDQNWAIRYLVVDTGHWLPGRQVLLSPYSLGRLDQPEKILRVNLTRKQIENCPLIGAHKPVSRQYEEQYHRYFGWPYYWQGNQLWGLSGFPILELPAEARLSEKANVGSPLNGGTDPHLRSTQALSGYQLQTGEGIIGHVCDFMVDAANWAIGQLVVKTGHRLTGKEVLIEVKNVGRISYEESIVFAEVTPAPVPQTPVRHSDAKRDVVGGNVDPDL